MRVLSIVFLFTVLCVANAKAAGDSAVQVNADSVISQLQQAQVAYNTLSVRTRLTWDDSETEQNFQGIVRLKYDSTIWLSLTGTAGVEGMRAYMQPDTFCIINRLGEEYMLRGFNALQRWISFPVSFTMLQQVLAGQKADLPGGKTAVMAFVEDSTLCVYFESDKMLEKIWVNSRNYTMSKMLLKDKMLQQEMSINFEDYKPVGEGAGSKLFSYKRTIAINRSGDALKLEMNITKVNVNSELTFPFDIPARFKKVE